MRNKQLTTEDEREIKGHTKRWRSGNKEAEKRRWSERVERDNGE